MILSLLGGFVLLLLGGEFLVRGASGLASRLGVPALVVGIVIVGFGPSAPELVTSIEAALSGAPGLAVGNIIGSNIANILLILGAGALIYPMTVARRALLRDGGIVIGTALLLAAAAYSGELTRTTGLAYIAGLAAYMWLLFTRERRKTFKAAALAGHDGPVIEDGCPPMWQCVVYTALGTAGIVLGGKFLVDGGISLAKVWGVSEEVIGLTIIAIGTSLPELATTVIAALRRHSEIALGNVLGSNVYNVLGIGGATATITPLTISPQVMQLDIPLMVGLSVVMVAIGAFWSQLSRWTGMVFLGGYGAYITTLLA